jgi:sugar/nucleoside kinase (ribokinase family)
VSARAADEASPLPPIDYLAVGHVCLDETDDGPRLGGTVAFAALAASCLGLRVGIVTSGADDLDLSAALPDIAVYRVPAPRSTVYRHDAVGGARQLPLLSRARSLGLDDVPREWRAPHIVHLAPIAGEVDRALARALRAPGVFVGATPQGWLRGWDAAGVVTPLPCEDLPFELGCVDALVVSAEDLAAEPWGTAPLGSACSLLALTLSAAGVAIYDHGRGAVIPSCPASVRDTTGAGDVFAAVWFARLAGGDAPLAGARYAAAAAACTVEQTGLAGVPTARAIEERLAAWAR